jgi:hypothetical protein
MTDSAATIAEKIADGKPALVLQTNSELIGLISPADLL